MRALISGGSGSGKSRFAEEFVLSLGEGPRYYVATLMVYDEEGRRRIDRHRAMRAGKGFETIECPLHVADAPIPPDGIVLLECVSTLVSNEMFAPGGAGMDCAHGIIDSLAALDRRCAHLVLVSNDIFSDGVLYEEGTRRFMENLAAVNVWAANWADRVIEVTSSIPIQHK